jgi:hypothetical protein
MQKQFNPPPTIVDNKQTYTYLETKNENNKGQKLSESCYWYLCNGVRVAFSKGNIEAILIKS